MGRTTEATTRMIIGLATVPTVVHIHTRTHVHTRIRIHRVSQHEEEVGEETTLHHSHSRPYSHSQVAKYEEEVGEETIQQHNVKCASDRTSAETGIVDE